MIKFVLFSALFIAVLLLSLDKFPSMPSGEATDQRLAREQYERCDRMHSAGIQWFNCSMTEMQRLRWRAGMD